VESDCSQGFCPKHADDPATNTNAANGKHKTCLIIGLLLFHWVSELVGSCRRGGHSLNRDHSLFGVDYANVSFRAKIKRNYTLTAKIGEMG
jgi:hypothetical protein